MFAHPPAHCVANARSSSGCRSRSQDIADNDPRADAHAYSHGNAHSGGAVPDRRSSAVAGAKAQYKRFGTINGSGSYRFMLTAIDGQVSG